MGRRGPLFVVVVLAALVVAAAASAYRGTAGPSLSVRSQTHVEALAELAATPIAGRVVRVRCESRAEARRHSAGESGFVQTTYDPVTKRFVRDADTIALAPEVCSALARFANARIKPTMCTREGGSASAPCFLVREVDRDSPGSFVCTRNGSVKCYAITAKQRGGYWDAYREYAQALMTLAHEAVHVRQATLGMRVPPDSLVEAQATCSGLQWLANVARILGDTRNDARSIASFFWLVEYPGLRHLRGAYARKRPYWSRQCRPGGALDIRAPGTVPKLVWPNGPRPTQA